MKRNAKTQLERKMRSLSKELKVLRMRLDKEMNNPWLYKEYLSKHEQYCELVEYYWSLIF